MKKIFFTSILPFLCVATILGVRRQREEKKISNPFMIMSPQDVPSYIKPSLLTGNSAAVAQGMSGIPIERTTDILNAIFNDVKNILTHKEKLMLLFATLRNYQDDLLSQKMVLDVTLNHPSLAKGEPLLLVAAFTNYSDSIPIILAWLEDKKEKGIELDSYFNDMVFSAYSYAIDRNLPKQFNKLQWAGIALPQAVATELLWKVIKEQKNPRFIELLHLSGANLDATEQGKYTPLIWATKLNDKAMVKALLNAGATLNLVIDAETGSALQIAIGKGYREIEAMIRSHNGEEPLPSSWSLK